MTLMFFLFIKFSGFDYDISTVFYLETCNRFMPSCIESCKEIELKYH